MTSIIRIGMRLHPFVIPNTAGADLRGPLGFGKQICWPPDYTTRGELVRTEDLTDRRILKMFHFLTT